MRKPQVRYEVIEDGGPFWGPHRQTLYYNGRPARTLREARIVAAAFKHRGILRIETSHHRV